MKPIKQIYVNNDIDFHLAPIETMGGTILNGYILQFDVEGQIWHPTFFNDEEVMLVFIPEEMILATIPLDKFHIYDEEGMECPIVRFDEGIEIQTETDEPNFMA